MRVRFDDPSLERLEVDPRFNAGFEPGVVKAFRKRIQFIRDAADERDLRNMKSLHYEKLKGNRSHQHSMRLNRQWRLIFEIEGQAPSKTIAIQGIEDYH